jgi:hypothetical protein
VIQVGTLVELIRTLRETCACLPEKRRGDNTRYAMADFGMAVFSNFFMQCPSFLAHQRLLEQGAGHGRSNCETLLEMTSIWTRLNRRTSFRFSTPHSA